MQEGEYWVMCLTKDCPLERIVKSQTFLQSHKQHEGLNITDAQIVLQTINLDALRQLPQNDFQKEIEITVKELTSIINSRMLQLQMHSQSLLSNYQSAIQQKTAIIQTTQTLLLPSPQNLRQSFGKDILDIIVQSLQQDNPELKLQQYIHQQNMQLSQKYQQFKEIVSQLDISLEFIDNLQNNRPQQLQQSGLTTSVRKTTQQEVEQLRQTIEQKDKDIEQINQQLNVKVQNINGLKERVSDQGSQIKILKESNERLIQDIKNLHQKNQAHQKEGDSQSQLNVKRLTEQIEERDKKLMALVLMHKQKDSVISELQQDIENHKRLTLALAARGGQQQINHMQKIKELAIALKLQELLQNLQNS